MRVYLVRHGETTHNRDNICQGQYDSQLTDLGKEQARRLANRFEGHSFSQIFSSDLLRARDTVENLQKYSDKEILYLKDLREKSQGIYENIHSSKVPYVDYVQNPDFKYEGAESLNDQIERVEEFLNSVELKDKTLILSHGGTIKAILKILLGLSIEEARNYKTSNTCVYILKKEGDKFEIELQNCTKHLE